jgi:protein-S-isoprenylcysteine O-methyltransferase Ste14
MEQNRNMNWKPLSAIAVVVLLGACVAVLFPQCDAGRALCRHWKCFSCCLFMGIISLGLAAVVAISGNRK